MKDHIHSHFRFPQQILYAENLKGISCLNVQSIALVSFEKH
jgi:hypothetical protein